MSNHSVRRSRAEVRAYMAAHGVNYTTAARALAEQADAAGAAVPPSPAGPPVVDDGFGGHEFEYERDTDLFRCTECREYEIVARKGGTITTCPGLAGWNGDPERVYLLVTENPAVFNVPWHVSVAARQLGTGRPAKYGYGKGRLLVETAPSVVDQLHRTLAAYTAPVTHDADGPRALVATAIERLSAEQGQALIAENYAAYVAQYGDPDSRTGTVFVIHEPLTLADTSTYDEAAEEDGDYFGDE